MELRPFEDGDYPRMVEIRNAIYPDDPTNVSERRRSDSNWEQDRYFKERVVAVEGGHVVAVGEVSHMPEQFHPDRYSFSAAVDPAHQRRGIGGALYDHALTLLRSRGAALVRSEAKESRPESVRFLQQRGFGEVQRFWESRLDVAGADATLFAEAEARTAASGILITTFAAERERIGDGAVRASYDLDVDVSRDIPATDPVTATSYEHYVKSVLESPNLLTDGWFIALDGERYAGASGLWRSQELPDVVFQGLTGVRREYRRRGIAQTLKMHGLRYAKAHGYREIRTWNNTRNRAMLGINEPMGFVKQPAWIELEKPLAGADRS